MRVGIGDLDVTREPHPAARRLAARVVGVGRVAVLGGGRASERLLVGRDVQEPEQHRLHSRGGDPASTHGALGERIEDQGLEGRRPDAVLGEHRGHAVQGAVGSVGDVNERVVAANET